MQRKPLILIFLLSFLFSSLNAQEMTVKSFAAKTQDLSASTNVRTDNNGVACALVKVQLVADGAQFEPNVIGSVARKVNEYWVYLPAGSKHLKVKHPNYLTSDVVFSDYGISSLESKCTYELVLTIPDSKPTQNVVTSQYLVLNVTPNEAIVEVNGEMWTNNNGTARKFVPFGDYTYNIHANGYNPKQGTVSVNDPNQKVVVNVSLNRNINVGVIIKNLIDNMVRVQGGIFTMGAASEQEVGESCNEPAHQVTVPSFSIGKYEVTQEEWQAVMGNNPSYFKGAKRPVESVSWDDCQEFIRKLNAMTGMKFRLPTEAEWEFAARGGNKSRHTIYSGSFSIDAVAWYGANSDEQTHNVGQKSPNELGLYDMTGNVHEWCQDWYGSYSSSSQSNPCGPSSGSYRVTRGGCWSNYEEDCIVSYRKNYAPDDSGSGLRLAM